MRELAKLAFSRIDHIASWTNGELRVYDSDKINHIHMAAIRSIEQKSDDEGNRYVKVTLWNKEKALELLGKHFALFTERREVEHSGGITMDTIRQVMEDAE